MNSGKFVPEKVLNIKQQDGRKIVLIQWKGYSIQQATWQPYQKFDNIDLLIEEYQQTKINDRVKNFALKQTEKIGCGENPYEETGRHGHFMYGDQPESIQSVKVFSNQEDSPENTTIVCEVKWRDRQEIDNEGNKVFVILQNSFMDSKTINQFRPDFLLKFYQQRISLQEI